jgi:transposase
VFGGRTARPEPTIHVKSLHAKIGELTLENFFWKVRSAKPAC